MSDILQSQQPLTLLEATLINRLQDDLPLTERPYLKVAEELGIAEEEVIATLQSLLERKILTRFGPLFDIAKANGFFALCALEVPESEFDTIAHQVNQFKEVAHNYRRTHRFNMWFVLAGKSEKAVKETFDAIVTLSQCRGIFCPKEKEFYVGLKLRAEADTTVGYV